MFLDPKSSGTAWDFFTADRPEPGTAAAGQYNYFHNLNCLDSIKKRINISEISD